MALGLGRSKMMVPYNKTRTCNCINLFEYINLKNATIMYFYTHKLPNLQSMMDDGHTNSWIGRMEIWSLSM